MDAQTWVASIAAAIALIAIYFNHQAASAAARSANEAAEQTRLQRQIRQDSMQPYVWVDIRSDKETAELLNLVLSNAGPTVATNVKVTVEPALTAGNPFDDRIREALDRLATGLPSLTPGRLYQWPLGLGHQLLKSSDLRPYTFTVTATGPYGDLEPISYAVDLDVLGGALVRTEGSLHKLTKAVEKIGKTLER